jgi:prepilin-type N-terminal cleavage/methylation domain-containing protein
VRQRQAGFTLVELMISLVLFSFAIAGVLAVAVSMSQGFREQRAAVGAEGAVRVPLDFITDAIRQASPGAPTGLIWDTTNLTCSNTAMVVTNNQTSLGSVPAPVVGWDKLDVIFASGAVITSTRAAITPGATTVDVDDASQLVVGDFVVVSDTTQAHLFKIVGKAGNTLTFNNWCANSMNLTSMPPTGQYNAGSLVIRAQHAVFTIDLVDGVPTLMMDPDQDGLAVPEPLAEGVEDIQIAVGYDADGNGITENGAGANDDEWVGNNAGDPICPNIAPGCAPVGQLCSCAAGILAPRAVRVTLIARTTSGLIGNLMSYTRPAAEDHAASATPDNYRRRVLRSMVEVRNMTGSP